MAFLKGRREAAFVFFGLYLLVPRSGLSENRLGVFHQAVALRDLQGVSQMRQNALQVREYPAAHSRTFALSAIPAPTFGASWR